MSDLISREDAMKAMRRNAEKQDAQADRFASMSNMEGSVIKYQHGAFCYINAEAAIKALPSASERKQEKTIRQNIISQIDEVCGEICDNYCKWPERCDTEEQLLEEHCNSCPIVTRL